MILNVREFFIPAGAGVNRFVVNFVGRGSRSGEFLSRAGAGINCAGVEKLLKHGAIERDTMTLGIGAEGTAAIRAFLPLQAKPVKVFQHGRDKFRAATVAIEVFVAENERAAMGLGALLRDPEGSSMAEMQKSGGGRREATAVPRDDGPLRRVHSDSRRAIA